MKNLALILSLIAFFTLSMNVKATNTNLPQGIIYQIEINAADIHKTKNFVDEYHYLRKITLNDKEFFQFGKFTAFNDADDLRTKLITAGCKNASIIAFNNQEEISVAEAINYQYKNTLLTAENKIEKDADLISNVEASYLLQVQRSGLKHYYALAIPVNSVELVDKLFEIIDNEQVMEINLEDNIYSIGNYATLEEVVLARKKYMNNEIENVYVMAQITDTRLTEQDTQNLALTIQSVMNGLASK
ncbi:MAG: hypothetical protein K0B10_08125 [Vicingaceae bacterium]|nr:hypothetical protein [Vicingaceae bacterium]